MNILFALALLLAPVPEGGLQIAHSPYAAQETRFSLAIGVRGQARELVIRTNQATLDPSSIQGALSQCSGQGTRGAVCQVTHNSGVYVPLVPRPPVCGQPFTVEAQLDRQEAQTVSVPYLPGHDGCGSVWLPVAR